MLMEDATQKAFIETPAINALGYRVSSNKARKAQIWHFFPMFHHSFTRVVPLHRKMACVNAIMAMAQDFNDMGGYDEGITVKTQYIMSPDIDRTPIYANVKSDLFAITC